MTPTRISTCPFNKIPGETRTPSGVHSPKTLSFCSCDAASMSSWITTDSRVLSAGSSEGTTDAAPPICAMIPEIADPAARNKSARTIAARDSASALMTNTFVAAAIPPTRASATASSASSLCSYFFPSGAVVAY